MKKTLNLITILLLHFALIVTSCSKNTSENAVQDVHLNFNNLELKEGGFTTLGVTIIPSNATNKRVIWTSSNDSIAIVHDGLIKALRKGTADIIARTEDGNKTDICHVIVSRVHEPVTSISLNCDEISILEDSSAILIATILPEDATNKNIEWRSSDTTIATVKDGRIQALSGGEVTITATTQDENKTATCKVKVSYPYNYLELPAWRFSEHNMKDKNSVSSSYMDYSLLDWIDGMSCFLANSEFHIPSLKEWYGIICQNNEINFKTALNLKEVTSEYIDFGLEKDKTYHAIYWNSEINSASNIKYCAYAVKLYNPNDYKCSCAYKYSWINYGTLGGHMEITAIYLGNKAKHYIKNISTEKSNIEKLFIKTNRPKKVLKFYAYGMSSGVTLNPNPKDPIPNPKDPNPVPRDPISPTPARTTQQSNLVIFDKNNGYYWTSSESLTEKTSTSFKEQTTASIAIVLNVDSVYTSAYGKDFWMCVRLMH